MVFSSPLTPSAPSQRGWVGRVVDDVLAALRLGLAFLPLVLASPLLVFARTRPLFVSMLVQSVRRAGPVASKCAQWIAARPDLFPPSVCSALASFQHTAPAHGIFDTFAALHHDPAALASVSHLDPVPLGSGCVAQVHRARYGSQDAAVKVLHPHVRERVAAELRWLARAAWALSWVMPHTAYYADVEGSVATFSASMEAQLDLTREADHLRRFAAMFAGDADVVFPRVLHASPDVLIMSHEEGVHLTEVVADPSWPERERIAAVGLRTFFQMLFVHNLVHADLHGGNVLVRRGDGRIVVLDCGLVVSLQPVQRRNFLDLFMALSLGDGIRGARCMLDGSVGSHCEDPAQFQRDMDAIFRRVGRAHFGTAPLGPALLDVLRCTQRHRVRLDSSFASLVSAAIVLEGIGRQLNPALNLFYGIDVKVLART